MSQLLNQLNRRKVIYQVFCGRWEQANISEHCGDVFTKLSQFDWSSLRSTLGVTHVYLMGIWQNSGPIIVSKENDVDIPGDAARCPSPFAISDHSVVNPLLGTFEAFEVLIKTIHESNLEVIVDFVPNHTGLDHPWISTHPEFYKQDAIGSIQKAFSGDVAELNYENIDVFNTMGHVLRHIATMNVDGVRVDMAHLIPPQFFETVLRDIRSVYPHFVAIAEAYGNSVFDLTAQERLLDVGFDAIYDEPLYRNLKYYSQGGQLADVLGHFNFICTHRSNAWVHYVSNHDDTFPLYNDKVEVWQALFLLLPGWHLFYNGTLQGYKGRLSHHVVDIMMETYTNPSFVTSKLQRWFEWIQLENPRCGLLEHVDEDELILQWSGTTRGGVALFNLKDNTYEVRFCEHNPS